MKPRRISQAAYARERGVSQAAIRELVQRGIIVLNNQRKIDVEQADAACRENLNPARSQVLESMAGESEADPVSYHESRAMREKYNALSAQAEYLQTLGTLVSVAAVRDETFTVFRMLRDNLELIGPRIAQRLAAETDPMRCERLITEQHKAILNELSRALAGELAEREPVSP